MERDSLSLVKLRGVLLVTVPADSHDSTIALLQEQVLHTMEQAPTKGVILDISAVDTLDSYFARMLSETTRMVALMGGQTVIAGMRPGVAITTTQLGLELGRVTTALNVERALDLLSHHLDGGRWI